MDNVFIPLKLNAFIFNKEVCDNGHTSGKWESKAKIAPITQPNYSLLRRDGDYLAADVLPQADGVKTRAQASDLLYNCNYLRTDGGDRFFLTGSGGGDSDKMPNLKNPGLNDQLSRLNNAQRGEKKNDRRFELVDPIKTRIENLQAKEKVLEGQVEDIKKEKNPPSEDPSLEDPEDLESELGDDDKANPFKAGVFPTFYQPRDPTLRSKGLILLIGILCSTRPRFIRRKMPHALWKSVKNLLQEFVLLKSRHPPLPPAPDDPECPPKDPKEDTFGTKPPKPVLAQEPLFHDGLGLDPVGNTPAWRDLWNDTQPWFPLFIEWEIEYSHVDMEHWELTRKRPFYSCHETVDYGIKYNVELAKVYAGETDHDTRRISGRILILPQSTFSLKAKLEQLFASTPPTEKDMEQCHRTRLLALLKKLDFLSAPLSGIGANMLTTEAGSHIRPAVKDPTSPDLHFMPNAARPDDGFTEVIMPLIRDQTGLTPYSSSHLRHSDRHSALKTVSHGQFKFTKIDIVDKFGQAIHAIDPTPAPAEKQPPVWPCISKWFAPQSLGPRDPGTNIGPPNVIRPSIAEPLSEYIQMPPQINQPSRLNSLFVIPGAGSHKKIAKRDDNRGVHESLEPKEPAEPLWQAANEWDQPIGVGLSSTTSIVGCNSFFPDGTFYREVRLRAGPEDKMSFDPSQEPLRLPFQKSDDPRKILGWDMQQLSRLVETLARSTPYLGKFIDMVQRASSAKTPAPSGYAEFRSALTGRPLALTYMAWSLELAGPEWNSQMDGDPAPSRTLLPPRIEDRDPPQQ
ncbi:hypothetical protein FACUT_2714 [Fusarium acutatum]|uniref:Uncharacterized protein n=1 Tax=Fusarium acutatum TaxID=78861 RepID=A0A8H4NRC3_9HYPO|nr:hypothetical protein FACUT_2714 [Fusarium acutatum]